MAADSALAQKAEGKKFTWNAQTLRLTVVFAVILMCFAAAIWLFNLPTERIWTDSDGAVETVTETERLPNYAVGGWWFMSVGALLLIAVLAWWAVSSRAKARR